MHIGEGNAGGRKRALGVGGGIVPDLLRHRVTIDETTPEQDVASLTAVIGARASC